MVFRLSLEDSNIMLFQDRMGEAKKSFKTASRIDESSMLACLGKLPILI